MHLTNGATWIRLNFTQLIFHWLISWEGSILSGSALLYAKKKHKHINAKVNYCLFPNSVVKQVKIIPFSWRTKAGWKEYCCFVCHMCWQRRETIWWEGWDPHWGTVPGVHTCCWLQGTFLWEFLLTPNTVRLKEKKWDLDFNHSKLSSWDDCGERVNTSYCWGLVCVMFANTPVCS